MPWLEKGEVLFVHVPRCGGTSITKHHRVRDKAREGKNWYYSLGILYYFYRYQLLETANFPFRSVENVIAVLQFLTATVIFVLTPIGFMVPYVMWATSTLLFFTSTFVWTAPSLRSTKLRTIFMYIQHYLLWGFGCDTGYLVGNNKNGILLHLTAERCCRYGYVSEEEMAATSFSIVRNPYSRMFSLYQYNKVWFESFDSFVRAWHSEMMELYYKRGYTDTMDIYCHRLPMHAYTHKDKKQLVKTIIKLEDLKRLVATNWKDSDVPEAVQKALTGIPHANGRKKKLPWHTYYTQETMDLVLEMYAQDFEIFGYSTSIPQRPDLCPSAVSQAVPVAVTPVSRQLVKKGITAKRSVRVEPEIQRPKSMSIDTARTTEIDSRNAQEIFDIEAGRPCRGMTAPTIQQDTRAFSTNMVEAA